MKKSKSSAPKALPIVIEFILDETGSMSSYLADTIDGFNAFLADQKSVDGLALMTLTKFDSSGLRTPYVDLDVKMVPNLSTATFKPNATTNLRDAIGTRAAALKARLSGWDQQPNVLVVVMTDGGDNASRSFSEADIRNLVAETSPKGWTFVYLGADQNALEISERLGFAPGNTKSFASNRYRETMADLSAKTTVYRAERAQAVQVSSTTTYFSDR